MRYTKLALKGLEYLLHCLYVLIPYGVAGVPITILFVVAAYQGLWNIAIGIAVITYFLIVIGIRIGKRKKIVDHSK